MIAGVECNIEGSIFEGFYFAEFFEKVYFGVFHSIIEKLGAVLDIVFGDGEIDLVGAVDPLTVPKTSSSSRTDVIGRFTELFEKLRDRLGHVFRIMDTTFHAGGSLGDFFFDALDFAETAIEGDLADFVRGGSLGLAWQNGDATAVFFELCDLFFSVVFFYDDKDVRFDSFDEMPFGFANTFDDDGVGNVEEIDKVVTFALWNYGASGAFAFADFFVTIHGDDKKITESTGF